MNASYEMSTEEMMCQLSNINHELFVVLSERDRAFWNAYMNANGDVPLVAKELGISEKTVQDLIIGLSHKLIQLQL